MSGIRSYTAVALIAVRLNAGSPGSVFTSESTLDNWYTFPEVVYRLILDSSYGKHFGTVDYYM